MQAQLMLDQIQREAFAEEFEKVAAEKTAMIPILGGVLGHVGANAAISGIMRNKHLSQRLGTDMMRAAFKPTKGAYVFAAAGGVAPELEMAYTHAGHAVKDFSENDKYRHLRAYYKVIAGKSKDELMNGAMTDKGRRHIQTGLDLVSKHFGGGKSSGAFEGNPLVKQMRAGDIRGLQKVLDVKEKSPILSNILPAALKEHKRFTGGHNMPTHPSKSLPAISTASMAATTAFVDPVLGIWSAAKRFIGGKSANVGPIKGARNISRKKLVTDPIRKNYNKGAAGENIRFRGLKRVADELALNPVTSQAKNTAYDLGRAVNKARQEGY